jgi:DNA-binding CsgD family transcriptional regulator/tetratricopeptide (TPR) repeat protein
MLFEESLAEADHLISRGQTNEAIVALEQLLAREPAKGAIRARALLALANAQVLNCRTAEAAGTALSALSEASQSLDRGAIFDISLMLVRIYNALSMPREALKYVEVAETQASVAAMDSLPTLFCCRASAYSLSGRIDDAIYQFKIAVQLAEKRGNTSRLLHVLGHFGMVASDLGQPEAAIECLNRAFELCKDEVGGWVRALYAVFLSSAYARRGLLTRAEEFIKIGFENDDSVPVLAVHRAIGGMTLGILLRDQHLLSRSYDTTLLQVAITSGEPQLIGPLASTYYDYLVSLREYSTARQIVRTAANALRSADESWELFVRLAEFATAAELSKARELMDKIPKSNVVSLAFGFLFDATFLLRTGALDASRLAGRAACDAFDQLKWPAHVARSLIILGDVWGAKKIYQRIGARTLASELHVRSAPGRPRRALPDITARQHGIMLRMADGLTNSEIATELHLSKSTVDHHISELYRRLNVRNRSQLLKRVHSKGLAPSDG